MHRSTLMHLRGTVFGLILGLGLGLGGLAATAAADPVGTAFTYQGSLSQDSQKVSGTYDMRFSLFSAAAGGAPVVTQCLDGVSVTDGVFTVNLDFGAAFGPDARWIEIAVRADSTPANCGSG